MGKLVEAPGVEGRGEGSGFDGLREGSRREGLGFAELPPGGQRASDLAEGFVEVGCSTEGRGSVENGRAVDLEAPGAYRSTHHDSSLSTFAAGRELSEVELLGARLRAVEHVLVAAEALLEARDIEGAQAILRAFVGRLQCGRP
jgi:hypothetical protein